MDKFVVVTVKRKRSQEGEQAGRQTRDSSTAAHRKRVVAISNDAIVKKFAGRGSRKLKFSFPL